MSQDALDKEKSVRPGDGPSDVAPMGAGEEAGSGDEGDAVDRIVAQWRRERPDLDPSAKEITGRLVRLADLVQLRFRDAFADLGMSEGDYGLLAPLRRAGAPYELTPTALARARMMTSGGLTPALDRLEKRGWIERVPNPDDRRGSLVRLTADGLALIDDAMERHVDAEQAFVAGLSGAQRDRLTELLRRLLLAVDDP